MTDIIVGIVIGICFILFVGYTYSVGRDSAEVEIERSIMSHGQFMLRGKLHRVQRTYEPAPKEGVI